MIRNAFARLMCPAILVGFAALTGAAAEAQDARCALSAEDIYANTGGSVVQIQSISINPYLVMGRMEPRIGTGFVTDPGHVLTNYHVVADSDDIVIFQDEKAIMAEVIGIDPALDLALLRPASDVIIAPPLPFAPPEEIAIGQDVFVIGYPLGIGKSISKGIVSGMSRILPWTTSSWLSPYIQTDAAVSPGDSGGPLLDACGRVIGLISSQISASGAENVAFAIPVGVLGPVVDELGRTGHVSRPWHGLYGQMVTPVILQMMGAPPEAAGDLTGFLVETVEPGSAADRAGLRGGVWPVMWGPSEILLGGDIILDVNGEWIDTLDTALRIVRGLQIGDTVTLTVLRDGSVFTTSVVVEERPILEREMEIYRYPPERR